MTHQTQSSAAACCDEFARLTSTSRRGLLRGALLGGLAVTLGDAVITTSPASAATARAVMVVLSLRGAADGLSLVVPHGDPVYYQARPRIAVPADKLIAKDDFFGLHPAFEPLLPMWNAGSLAAVHAAGLPAPNRSHFSAMEELEDAAPGSSTRTGWLNRLIGADSIASPLQAFALGSGPVPASLIGPEPAMAASSVGNVKIPGADVKKGEADPRLRSLHQLWDGRSDDLGRAMSASFGAVADFATVANGSADPQNGATYPSSDLGRALAQVARIVRADVGVEVVTIDHGNWDMHSDMGNLQWGDVKTKTTELAGSLAAFFTDLGTLAEKVTVVCLSEFGRRVVENANWGTDHGYGTTMFALGAGVKGGYHGRWPGLTKTGDADVLVTTDYRSVLTEVVRSRFNASIPAVFPGFTPTRVGMMVGQ
ncbi:DUF1501 domain-containing protein [Nocardioides sp.]|uniref:DUF1501 domain-containing protein n=1 Tax=Nocardioides sp. TaxID=35761 RepID=UPI0039E6641B